MSSAETSPDSVPAPAQNRKAGQLNNTEHAEIVKNMLGERTIVFVGIMGVGKSTIGWRVARLLDMPFLDADSEIERAADMSVAEIFEKFGEPYFRAGERRVIERILKKGNQVLATGGGAFMDQVTRKTIAENGVSVWLDADIELIMQRVMRRKTRPLLQQENPRGVIEKLLEARNPIYAEADFKFQSHDVPRDIIAAEIVAMLAYKLTNQTRMEKP